jgi:hypothetical protein
MDDGLLMSNDKNVQLQIHAKIDEFSRELEALVRKAALGAVADALGQNAPAAAKRPGRPPAAHKPAKAEKAAAPAKAAKRRGRPARGGGIGIAAAAAEQILAYFKSHPGQRADEARSALRIDRNAWKPAVSKLLSERKLRKTGDRGSTTYHVA